MTQLDELYELLAEGLSDSTNEERECIKEVMQKILAYDRDKVIDDIRKLTIGLSVEETKAYLRKLKRALEVGARRRSMQVVEEPEVES